MEDSRQETAGYEAMHWSRKNHKIVYPVTMKKSDCLYGTDIVDREGDRVCSCPTQDVAFDVMVALNRMGKA